MVRNLSKGMEGEDVRLLHDELERFGYRIPEDEKKKKYFGDKTHDAVIEFQKKQKLDATGIVGEATVSKLQESGKEKIKLKVSGKVVLKAGVVARGVKVIAIDKGMGEDVVLGEAITDSSGNYTIEYEKESLQNRGKQKADIEIKIVDPEDRSKIYGTSSVHFNIGSDEKINLLLKKEITEKTSEYNRIVSDLKPHIKISFKDMREDKERQDISYLANKTGLDARLVAMVSLSEKYSVESKIPAELYYALFRAGLPTNADRMYRTTSENVKKIWEKAVEENIIEASFIRTIKQHLAEFKEQGWTHLLEKAKPVGISSLKDMLSISLKDSSKQKEFVDLYFSHTGDMKDFWPKAQEQFGKETAAKLQLDGKLGYLTVNNAPLISKLRTDNLVKNNPVDLIRHGLYKTETWDNLLSTDIKVPEEMPGETEQEKKKNYINYMVYHLKRSYPTAVVAEMVNNDELSVGDNVKDDIYTFFQKTQGIFEIGMHPVEKFLQENNIELNEYALNKVKGLQRVFQISPSDDAMEVLWKNNINSAYTVIQYDEAEFIENFAEDLGGQYVAKMTYAKANQVHSIVLNLATSYLGYRVNPKPYVISGVSNENGKSELIGYPTLEELFEAFDYCTCGHCRSVLSPAAYLVELLQLLDLNKYNSDGERTPHTYEKENPVDVLLSRRPDIEYIQLTCENTNTVLPYIDLVNEILEYFAVNKKIEGFSGFNVENITSEELMANPQFVNNEVYEKILKKEVYPFNLPFNHLLEALRLYYDHLKVPLNEAMEKLRVDDTLDTSGGTDQLPYAWRDIYNEYLSISPEEYVILTDSGTKELPAYFGEDESMSFYDFNEKYSNAKVFSRRTGITYNDLIEIIKTQFINPDSHLIPKLEKLRVSFAEIKDYKEGDLSDVEFDNLIPDDIDQSKYGGDVKNWIKDNDNYEKIMHLILLIDIEGEEVECGFDKVELKYSLPDNTSDNTQNNLNETDYWRLLRFIRLWKKSGYTIEETDKIISGLFKDEFVPDLEDTEETKKSKLDNGFKDLLIKIALLKKIQQKLDLEGRNNLIKLLSFWSNIDTHGNNSIYKNMFLNASIQKTYDEVTYDEIANVFREDGFGGYLQDIDERITDHLPALQAAFNVTEEELSLILKDAGFDEDSLLSLENVSRIYRYNLLAKALKISIQEFITLKTISGIDPFHELEYVHPSTLKFVELAQLIGQSEFKIKTLSYFLQHEDVTGEASPSRDSILSFAKTIKDGLVRIEQEHKVEDDPTGEIARSKMALVYENDTVERFFGLLYGTSTYSVDYNHPEPELEEDIKNISSKISYDHFRKLLTYQGVMTEGVKTQFESAESATTSFKDAVNDLYESGQDDFKDFFDKFPDLKVLYENYASSDKPEKDKINDILEDFLPYLKKKLKHLFIEQTLSSSINVDLTILKELLEKEDIMNSIEQGNVVAPAIKDFLELEKCCISACFTFSDGTFEEKLITGIDTRIENNEFPADPGGSKINASFKFYLEASDNEYYNFYIETDTDAKIVLSVNGSEIEGTVSDEIWMNNESIELEAGKLHLFELEIANVKDKAILKWESMRIAREGIPVKYLYPYKQVQNFSDIYIRLLKAVNILEALKLRENEILYFSTESSFQIAGTGFLNAIPVSLNQDETKVRALFEVFIDLLRYAGLKESLKVKDAMLVSIFEDPDVKNENGENMLLIATGWDESSIIELFKRFNWISDDLSDFQDFRWDLEKILRFNEAFDIVSKFGIRASYLLQWTTNKPVSRTLRHIQDTLRAKYDESQWLNALQPINDKLRTLRRDALVSHILHEMQKSEATSDIDTPDKLFEYFLIDVEMDPCMKTSRIKQAISTIQLFIHRCLMNLEQDVSPSLIKADHWKWMKNYRVWEANRKIFIYPENWLEPEFRDNKSSFFRDLEGELLQADITDELAETALLNYLEKLDEVAKLDICAMHFQENENGNKYDDILHVFGRTTGASRKYYYRRFDGNWSPWEKVDLDIEDNPILPVVWNNRLFLFWLNIVRRGPDGKPIEVENESAFQLETDDLNNPVKQTIEVNLSWSEYYNNKWQPRRTSDFDEPVKLGEFEILGFKRSEINISSSVQSFGNLILYLDMLYKIYFYQIHKKSIAPANKNMGQYIVPFYISCLARVCGRHPTMGVSSSPRI